MIEPVRRSLRWLGSAIVIAAAPIGAFSATEATAQVPPAMAIPGMPGMGESYPLTPELVAAWVESFPSVFAFSQSLADEFDVPEGETPAAGLAAYTMVAGALARMNIAASEYGFTDYGQWVSVMFSVITAYSIVGQDVPPEAVTAMMAMFNITQESLDAVAANLDAVANVVDNL